MGVGMDLQDVAGKDWSRNHTPLWLHNIWHGVLLVGDGVKDEIYRLAFNGTKIPLHRMPISEFNFYCQVLFIFTTHGSTVTDFSNMLEIDLHASYV